MAELLLVVFVVAFLFGLVQWARGGALLWDIVRRTPPKGPAGNDASDGDLQKAKLREKETLQDLESVADRLLRSSLRVLGILALSVWLFIIASVVLDVLGFDWMERLSFRTNQMWGDPTTRSGARSPQSGAGRGHVLRSLGSGLR